MSKAGISRVKMTWERDFTIMPNAWLRDPKLSFKAKGLLAYMMSHEPGYILYIDQIMRETLESKGAISTARKELVEAGYLVEHQTKDERGYNSGLSFELLNPESNNPKLDNPELENPTLDNQTALRKQISLEKKLLKENKEKETIEFFESFFEIYPNARGKTEALKSYRKAITKLTPTEINEAALKFANDPNLPIAEMYIPMPQTWLNQERWTDPPLPINPLNVKPQRTKTDGDF